MLEPQNLEKKLKSGIILPDTAEKAEMQYGKVLALGPGRVDEKGQLQPLNLKVGDLVLFAKYGPTEIKVEDSKTGNTKELLIAKEEDILARIEYIYGETN